MFKFTKNDLIDIDKYEERLRIRGYILYDRDRMYKECRYYETHAFTCSSLAVDYMTFASGGNCFELGRDSIIDFLVNYQHCPEHYFRTHKTKGLSIDMNNVLSKLYDNGFAHEFFDDYFESRSWSSKTSKLNKIVESYRAPAGVNEFGVETSKITFSVNRQKNLRFNYRNIDIISELPREVCNCVTVDDGYFLAWGDFAQSDFRIAYNTFLRSPENDKLMNAYSDKYEALARIVANINNSEFDYDQFKEDRQLYKKLTLATLYGLRDSAVNSEKQFIYTFTKFLDKCPGYVEYVRRLNLRIELGLPIIITSYFGNESMVNVTRYQTSVMNDALNQPVQTGTSEVVILVVNKILDIFYEMGLTEDDISVYYVRHDEPIFRISKQAIKYMWVLEQFKEIFIDDWSPLHLDFKFGYYYKIEDESLTTEIQTVTESNRDKIITLAAGEPKINTYCPVPDVFVLSVCWEITPDNKAIVTFYDSVKNRVQYSLFDTVNEDEIINEVRAKVCDAESNIYNGGYRGIVIYNHDFSNEDFIGNSFINYKATDGATMYRVHKLCDIMLYKYCNQLGLEYSKDKPVISNYDSWYSAVSTLNMSERV